jgi:RNA polymerase sigma-70 factor (ECF subfamily)
MDERRPCNVTAGGVTKWSRQSSALPWDRSSSFRSTVRPCWGWRPVDEAAVADARAWLSTAASRLCLDKLKSGQRQREVYPGPWLPEPVITDQPIDHESISLAFLVLLERLTPVERAAYLLHQVFDYSHREVAGMLELTEEAARQVFHRAKAHVDAGRPRFAPSEASHARMLTAFLATLTSGDLSGLRQLLSEDALLCADGGGKAKGAAPHPIVGRERVAKFLLGLARRLGGAQAKTTIEIAPVNGWPAIVVREAGAVFAVINIETDGDRILAVRNVVNPEKLILRTLS